MVGVSFVTRQALAQVTSRTVYADAVRLASEIVPVLSFIAGVCVIPNSPINNHGKRFKVEQLYKTRKGGIEVALFRNEGVAAGVKLHKCRIIFVLIQGHSLIVHPIGNVSLATPNARARVVLIDAASAVAYAYGYAPRAQLFFPSEAL